MGGRESIESRRRDGAHCDPGVSRTRVAVGSKQAGSAGNMISAGRDDRNGLDIEMFRVPPISIDDLPDMLLCKFQV